MTNKKETLTNNKGDTQSELRPFSKEVELIVHRNYHTISVCPNILMEVMNNDPNTFIPNDWELTQNIFDEVMNDSIDEDFYEGDLYDIQYFLDKELYSGGRYEFEDINQEWVWEHKIKWSLCNIISLWNSDKTESTSYLTPKKEYGGLGTGWLFEKLTEQVIEEMSPFVNNLEQLGRKVKIEKEVN